MALRRDRASSYGIECFDEGRLAHFAERLRRGPMGRRRGNAGVRDLHPPRARRATCEDGRGTMSLERLQRSQRSGGAERDVRAGAELPGRLARRRDRYLRRTRRCRRSLHRQHQLQARARLRLRHLRDSAHHRPCVNGLCEVGVAYCDRVSHTCHPLRDYGGSCADADNSCAIGLVCDFGSSICESPS